MTPLTVAAALVHTFATALLTGFMAVVQWSLVPAQHRLDGPAYTRLEQGMNQVLERLTPILMIAAAATGGATAGLYAAAGRNVWLLWAASTTGIVVMIVTTLRINAPLNAEIDRWAADAPPAHWQATRDRWEHGHAVRARTGLVTLAVALTALAWPR